MNVSRLDNQLIDLSIILVAYKSLDDLRRCLPTLQRQNVSFRYELIIVDNYGRDGIADYVATACPDAVYVSNPINSGYAGGNNKGLEISRGLWTLFLNPDTELWDGFLERLLTTARQFPDALITPKILNPNGTINACGNQMHYTGVTTCRGLNQPSDMFADLHAVPLLSGAASMGPTAVLRYLGGFDATYFMYFEDTDLSLRARLAGFPILCEARAVVTHHYGLGLSSTKFYYLERNRLLTFLKIFSGSTFLKLLPALLLTELLTWGYSLRGWVYVKARFQTYGWLWKQHSTILRQHRAIQKTRRVSDNVLLAETLVSLPFDQLINGHIGQILDTVTRMLYKVLKPQQVIRQTS